MSPPVVPARPGDSPPRGDQHFGSPGPQILIRGAPGGAVVALAAAILGLAVGILTQLGQGWLSGSLNAFVNSESAWLLAPFAVGALSRRPALAALAGVGCCTMQLVGYELSCLLRFHTTDWRMEAGWGIAAVLGGPLFGLAGRLVRFGGPEWRGLGPATLAAAFLTEGAREYGAVLHRPFQAAMWLAIGSAIALVGLRGTRDWRWLAVTVPLGLLVQVAVGHVYD